MALQVGNPRILLDRERGRVENGRQSQGGVFKVTYLFEVTGAGEASRDVNFPVWYQERPALSCGGEVDPSTVLVTGNFPWSSAMGGGFITVNRNGIDYYVGCRVILVVGGTADQKATIHFHTEGKGLQGPVN